MKYSLKFTFSARVLTRQKNDKTGFPVSGDICSRKNIKYLKDGENFTEIENFRIPVFLPDNVPKSEESKG